MPWACCSSSRVRGRSTATSRSVRSLATTNGGTPSSRASSSRRRRSPARSGRLARREVPLQGAPLPDREVDQVGGGGREVAPLAVLEGRLAGARGLEEAGHVHGGRLPPDLAEGLALPAHLWRPGVGPLRGQHLGVRVVRLLQPL